jgi:hypothetical protein
MAGRTPRDSAEVWRGRVMAQVRSGLSVSEWCAHAAVQPTTFYAWRKRLSAACVSAACVSAARVGGVGSVESVELVPIRVAGSGVEALTLMVGSVRVSVPSGVDARWFASVLKGLL